MKRLATILASLAILALTVSPALSCPLVVRQVSYPYAVKQAVVVKEYFPVYSVSYDREKAGIILELQRIAAAVEKLQGGQFQATGTAEDGLTILTNRCARCHTEGSLKGTDFVMFVGKELRTFSRPDMRAIAERVVSTDAGFRMPPDRQLADAELKAIEAVLESQVAAKKEQK